MKSKILEICGAPAIPVSQQLLDACDLKNEVNIEARGKELVVRALNPREGWEEAFEIWG